MDLMSQQTYSEEQPVKNKQYKNKHWKVLVQLRNASKLA